MSDALGDGRGLDQLAATFDVLAAAQEYAYSVQAAARAAGQRLAALEDGQTLVVAALLAALVAVDLRPMGTDDLDRWREGYEFALHYRERPA